MRFIIVFIILILMFTLFGCETAVPYEDALLFGEPDKTLEVISENSPAPTLNPTITPVITIAPTASNTEEPTSNVDSTPNLPEGHGGGSQDGDVGGGTPIPTFTPLPSPTPKNIPSVVTFDDLDEYDKGAANYKGYNEQLFYMKNHLGSLKVGVLESLCRIKELQVGDDGLNIIVEVLDYFAGDMGLEKLIIDNPKADDTQKENASLYGYGVKSDDLLRLFITTNDTSYFIRGDDGDLINIDADAYIETVLPAFTGEDPDDNIFDYVIICAIDREIARIEVVLKH